MAGPTGFLGNLNVFLGADTSGLKKGRAEAEAEYKKIEQRNRQLAQNVRSTLGSVAPWVTAAGAILAVGRAIAQIVQEARTMDQIRQQTGMTIDSIAGLGNAVRDVGGNFNDLSTAVTSFNTAIREAARDSQSEAAQAFRELGISVRDANGEFTTFDQVAEQIANRVAGWTDGVAKASNMNAVFGASATVMTRALNQGGAAIREAQLRVDAYGRSAGDIARKQLEFEEAAIKLDAALTRLRDSVITPLMGPLAQLARGMADFVDEANKLRESQRKDESNDPYAVLSRRIESYEASLKSLSEERNKLLSGEASVGNAFIGNDTLVKEYSKKMEQYAQTLKQLNAERDALVKGTPTQLPGVAVDASSKSTPRETRQAGLSPNEMRAFQEQMEIIRSEMNSLNSNPDAFSRSFAINQDTFDDTRNKLDALSEQYKSQADIVRNLAELKRQSYLAEQNLILDTASMAASTITAVFANSKKAAIASAIINTSVGVTRALRDVPWPFNWIQAALVAAQGAAQVAAIRSTNQSSGGSASSVSSGSGSSQGGASPSQSVHISGVDRGHFYSGTAVENLIGEINNAVKNGATLITTRNLAT